MKKIIIFLLVFVMVPSVVYAQDFDFNLEDYENQLASYDLSVFEKTLDNNTKSILKDLNIDNFSVENIANLSLNDFFMILKNLIAGKIELPLKAGFEILVFILLSSFIQTFKNSVDNSLENFYSTLSGLVLIIILVSKLSVSLAVANSTINLCADFVYAFVPVFGLILVSSGGIVTAGSTNTFLLLLSQALSFISSTIFLPLINCFLAIGTCSSLNAEYKLSGVTQSMKTIIIKIVSVVCALFVSILSIKTAVSAKADAMGLRSIRFAINSVVPIIGPSISEGLLSIQSYSSLIKTSVGVVGVIAIAFVFLPSIIEITLWRFVLTACYTVSNLFNDRCVSDLLGIFKDTFLLVNVLLILSMLTTVISFGLLIATKTG